VNEFLASVPTGVGVPAGMTSLDVITQSIAQMRQPQVFELLAQMKVCCIGRVRKGMADTNGRTGIYRKPARPGEIAARRTSAARICVLSNATPTQYRRRWGLTGTFSLSFCQTSSNTSPSACSAQPANPHQHQHPSQHPPHSQSPAPPTPSHPHLHTSNAHPNHPTACPSHHPNTNTSLPLRRPHLQHTRATHRREDQWHRHRHRGESSRIRRRS